MNINNKNHLHPQRDNKENYQSSENAVSGGSKHHRLASDGTSRPVFSVISTNKQIGNNMACNDEVSTHHVKPQNAAASGTTTQTCTLGAMKKSRGPRKIPSEFKQAIGTITKNTTQTERNNVPGKTPKISDDLKFKTITKPTTKFHTELKTNKVFETKPKNPLEFKIKTEIGTALKNSSDGIKKITGTIATNHTELKMKNVFAIPPKHPSTLKIKKVIGITPKNPLDFKIKKVPEAIVNHTELRKKIGTSPKLHSSPKMKTAIKTTPKNSSDFKIRMVNNTQTNCDELKIKKAIGTTPKKSSDFKIKKITGTTPKYSMVQLKMVHLTTPNNCSELRTNTGTATNLKNTPEIKIETVTTPKTPAVLRIPKKCPTAPKSNKRNRCVHTSDSVPRNLFMAKSSDHIKLKKTNLGNILSTCSKASSSDEGKGDLSRNESTKLSNDALKSPIMISSSPKYTKTGSATLTSLQDTEEKPKTKSILDSALGPKEWEELAPKTLRSKPKTLVAEVGSPEIADVTSEEIEKAYLKRVGAVETALMIPECSTHAQPEFPEYSPTTISKVPENSTLLSSKNCQQPLTEVEVALNHATTPTKAVLKTDLRPNESEELAPKVFRSEPVAAPKFAETSTAKFHSEKNVRFITFDSKPKPPKVPTKPVSKNKSKEEPSTNLLRPNESEELATKVLRSEPVAAPKFAEASTAKFRSVTSFGSKPKPPKVPTKPVSKNKCNDAQTTKFTVNKDFEAKMKNTPASVFKLINVFEPRAEAKVHPSSRLCPNSSSQLVISATEYVPTEDRMCRDSKLLTEEVKLECEHNLLEDDVMSLENREEALEEKREDHAVACEILEDLVNRATQIEIEEKNDMYDSVNKMEDSLLVSEINEYNITFAAMKFLQKHEYSSKASKGFQKPTEAVFKATKEKLIENDKPKLVIKVLPITPAVANEASAVNDADPKAFQLNKNDSTNKEEKHLVKISPIMSNAFSADQLFSYCIGNIQPQKKRTLKKISRNSKRYNESASYSLDIFTPDYINDIILNSLKIEHKVILKKDFNLEHNPCLENRLRILTWFVTIQDKMSVSLSMYFITVHLFDVALANIFIPNNMYQLVLITIAWMVTKYDGVATLKASDLLKLCENIYSYEQLKNMEKKLLRIFNYSFQVPQPEMFANYYLQKLKVSRNQQIVFTTKFIMESFSLSSQYSTHGPSSIASAAIYICLTSFYPGQNIYEQIEYVPGYKSPSLLVDLIKTMRHHLKKLTSDEYIKVMFMKYNTEETNYASEKLMQCIN